VGDSRCYRVRDGAIEQLTRDHTLRNVARYEHPDIGDDLISQIPENLLSRAIGQADKVEMDVATFDLLPQDAYLLCTDGVTRMLDDATMLAILQEEPDPTRACARLIDRANEAGGRDNVTALLIRRG
jgi:protein phosphatase